MGEQIKTEFGLFCVGNKSLDTLKRGFIAFYSFLDYFYKLNHV